ILTTGNVVRPNLAHTVRFISHHDGSRSPRLFPDVSGRIVQGKEFGPVIVENPVTNERESVEGPVLLLIDESDRSKFAHLHFPRLPEPRELPGDTTGNRGNLRVLGFGDRTDGGFTRNEGTVAFG